MKIKRYLFLTFGLIACLSVSVIGASYVCDYCGSEMTLVQHKASTCKIAGLDTYECPFSWCGHTTTVQLPLADHKYSQTDYLAPTCRDAGYIQFRCSVCKDTYRNTLVPDISLHEWELCSTTLSSCAIQGFELFECANCGEQKQETLPIDPNAHSLLPLFTEPQTCINDGYEREICDLCNYTVDTLIPADGQSHNFVYIEDRTDGSTSYEYYECSFCDVQFCKEIPVIHEHHYTESNRIEATPDVSGTVTYSCPCGSVYYAELDYVEPVPTTTANLAKTVLTGVWGFFGIYVPGFNFTFGQMSLGIVLCSISVYVIKFLLNLGGSGVSSRTSSTNKPRISDERKGDQY